MTTNHHDFDSINAQIAAIDLKAFAPGGSHHFTAAEAMAAPGDVLGKVCTVYRGIRSILVVLSSFPLIPTKWRQALAAFTNLLDQLCPQA